MKINHFFYLRVGDIRVSGISWHYSLLQCLELMDVSDFRK